MHGHKVLSIVWIHSVEAEAPAVDIAKAILSLMKWDDLGLMCTPSIAPLFRIDAKTLASELGQKYATQNYPSQGTPICKLHGPSIKPRSDNGEFEQGLCHRARTTSLTDGKHSTAQAWGRKHGSTCT